jgi:VIT1/CCC1 family predicted Fe2+/Mn2+ transporter
MQDHAFTLIVSAVGIGGALSGIVIGHFLTRSSQHAQWVRDNRKREFQEIVTAMSSMIVEHMYYTSSLGSDLPQSKQLYADAMKATSLVLVDRIYIHNEISERDIQNRFLDIMMQFRKAGSEFHDPAEKATALLVEIIAMARKG